MVRHKALCELPLTQSTALDVGPFKHKGEARGGKEKGEGGEEGKKGVEKGGGK